jgi:hypothetical protein
MNSIFTPFEKRKLTSKDKVLLSEWKLIHELCSIRKDISYTIVLKNKNDLPVIYEITYKIPSFIDLDLNKKVDNPELEKNAENEKLMFYPQFGDVHRLQITIPENFPRINAKPKGTMATKIWHPHIICHGDDHVLGRVDFNEGNFDTTTIVDRILQVADYLTYKNYVAEDREPYPYDLDVAHWIREIAEPMKWVIPEYGINYEKFGIKITEPVIIQKGEVQKETHIDEDIVVLDDDVDYSYEFPMDIIEDKTEEEINMDDDNDNNNNDVYEISEI